MSWTFVGWGEVIHYSPCSATAEWEGSLLALYREVGDTWNPTPGHKGYEREALVAKRMEEVRITIRLSHHHTAHHQTVTPSHLHHQTVTPSYSHHQTITPSHCHTIAHNHCHTITHTITLSHHNYHCMSLHHTITLSHHHTVTLTIRDCHNLFVRERSELFIVIPVRLMTFRLMPVCLNFFKCSVSSKRK